MTLRKHLLLGLLTPPVSEYTLMLYLLSHLTLNRKTIGVSQIQAVLIARGSSMAHQNGALVGMELPARSGLIHFAILGI